LKKRSHLPCKIPEEKQTKTRGLNVGNSALRCPNLAGNVSATSSERFSSTHGLTREEFRAEHRMNDIYDSHDTVIEGAGLVAQLSKLRCAD